MVFARRLAGMTPADAKFFVAYINYSKIRRSPVVGSKGAPQTFARLRSHLCPSRGGFMRLKIARVFLIGLLARLCMGDHSYAATFCVNSVDTLQSALTT